jgi:hypothetical protein
MPAADRNSLVDIAIPAATPTLTNSSTQSAPTQKGDSVLAFQADTEDACRALDSIAGGVEILRRLDAADNNTLPFMVIRSLVPAASPTRDDPGSHTVNALCQLGVIVEAIHCRVGNRTFVAHGMPPEDRDAHAVYRPAGYALSSLGHVVLARLDAARAA